MIEGRNKTVRIINGKVFLEEGIFRQADLGIRGEYIERFYGSGDSGPEPGEEILDASGCLVLPGLVDLHIHGCGNRDFGDGKAEALAEIAERQAAWGITSLCGTTMTLPEEQLQKAAEALKAYQEAFARQEPDRYRRGARILGLHMEGPFIAASRKGSQKEEDIRLPDPELVENIQAASGGRVRILTFAPELPGAEELIRKWKDKILLSLGHTDADYNQALFAMKQGVRRVTHLCNAMSPFLHRTPGVLGAASDMPGVMVELIADGIHNHPSMVRNVFRIFGDQRIILVSDSMRAAGMGDGVFELGGQKVRVQGKKALLEDGTIAASVTNLYQCFRTCVQEMGIPLESALRCASLNPARSVGAEREVGSIAPGKYADLLLADPETLELKQVILRGQILGLSGKRL